MEVVKIENSVVTSLFMASRPQGQQSLPQVIAAFVERYHFAIFPTKIDEIGERVSFKQGTFDAVGLDVDLYRDGAIVSSQAPTELLDRYLEDMTKWMDGYLGMKRIETHDISKSYESHLIVRSKAPLFSPLHSMVGIQERLGQELKKSTGLSVDFQPISFGFSPDNALNPGMKPIPFRIERRVGIAFSENLYYSAAPLPTEKHVTLLRSVERLVSG